MFVTSGFFYSKKGGLLSLITMALDTDTVSDFDLSFWLDSCFGRAGSGFWWSLSDVPSSTSLSTMLIPQKLFEKMYTLYCTFLIKRPVNEVWMKVQLSFGKLSCSLVGLCQKCCEVWWIPNFLTHSDETLCSKSALSVDVLNIVFMWLNSQTAVHIAVGHTCMLWRHSITFSASYSLAK